MVLARWTPQIVGRTSLLKGASYYQIALHRGLAGALLPPSGLEIHLEATCGPFINRVGDSIGTGTANLLASIMQTLVSSWDNPSNDILQAYWALYQDLFGPGEIFDTRIVLHIAWHERAGIKLSATYRCLSLQGLRSACGHAGLTRCH